MKQLAALLITLIALHIPGSAQDRPAPVRPDSERFYPIEQLRPGMKAIGYTVFEGHEPKPFELEILGVLNGFPNAGQSAVLSRLVGERMNYIGVFQGMSGSPVFVDGRLVGAVAFGYQFAKDPIAGITPIRQMVDLFETRSAGKSIEAPGGNISPRSISFSEILFNEGVNGAGSPLARLAGSTSTAIPLSGGQNLMPLATPLSISGISPEVVARFTPWFQSLGFTPVAGTSGTAPISDLKPVDSETLKPGSTVVVPLIRGDYSVSAAGTVTWRDGNRIYAFGHPFLSLGVSEFPMHEGEVVTVLSSAASSFKLSYPTGMVGVVKGDRSTGIYGELGTAPRMIPVEINMRTSRGESRRFSFDMVADRFLTPILMQMTLISTVTASERTIGDATLLINGSIRLAGLPPITIENRISTSVNAPISAAIAAAQPIGAIMSSGFRDLAFEKITLDIVSQDRRRTGQVDRLLIGRTELRRGDKVEVQVIARAEGGAEVIERVPLEIPLDAPLGPLQLTVGDGLAMQASDPRSGFTPRTPADLVAELNRLRKAGRLYLRLSQAESGAVIRNEELPSLLPSVLATLGTDRTVGGYTLTSSRIVAEKEIPPGELVITGQRTLKINVIQ